MGPAEGKEQAARMKKKKPLKSEKPKTKKKYSKPVLAKHGVLSIVEGD